MVMTSEQINAMHNAQMSTMGNMANYSAQLGPYGSGQGSFQAPAPAQPGMMQNLMQSQFAGGVGQMFQGYSAMSQALPGTPGAQRGMEQMQMGAVGMFVSPQTPILGQTVYQGMQQQHNLNRALESQFDFLRAGGRGFSGSQQAAIGAGFRQIAGQTPNMGMGELTGLMQQGAQLGQFQGVRDTTQMLQRTRELLKQWKTLAVELGTTMEEAQRVMASVKQIGVFQPGAQAAAVKQMATTAAITGVGIEQQIQMGAVGAQSAVGMYGQGVGVRAAGAQAAQSQLAMIGTAMRAGTVSEQQIFEATGAGGVQGQMLLAQRMNTASAKFMKRGRGKVTLAAFVNPDTMEIDQDAVQKFMSGGMNLSEIERRANQNASKMGYVKWRANKARMAGEFTAETGGMGHLALMRSFIGEEAMADTDRARIILAKQTGMSQSEIDAVMPMLRDLPALQNRIRNETRIADKQSQRAQLLAEHGPTAIMDRKKQEITDKITKPINDFVGALVSSFNRGFEDAVDEAMGGFEVQVSQATKERYAEAAIGGFGGGAASQGMRKDIAAMRGFQAYMNKGGEIPTLDYQKSLAGQGVLNQAAGAYSGLLKKMQGAGVGPVSDLGAFLAKKTVGKAVEDSTLGISDAGMLARIQSEGITDDALGLGAGTVQNLSKDQTIAGIMLGPASLDQKRKAVKEQAKSRNMELTDDQANAIMAAHGAGGGALVGPGGKQPTTIKELVDQNDEYLARVLLGSKSSSAGVDLGMENLDEARTWLADTEISEMLDSGKSRSEIKARAQEKFGSGAGEFFDRALAQKGGKQALQLQGKLRRGLEDAQYIQNLYKSDVEDLEKARKANQLVGLKEGGKDRRFGGIFADYEKALGKMKTDPFEAQKMLDDINQRVLMGDDAGKMVAIAREAGLDQLANTWATGLGKAEDIREMKGGIGKKRKAVAGMLLAGTELTPESQALLGKKKVTAEDYETIAEELRTKGKTGLAEQFDQLAGAGADKVAQLAGVAETRTQKAKEAMEKEQIENAQRKKEMEEAALQASVDTAAATVALKNAAESGGLVVRLHQTQRGWFKPKLGEEEES